ncbi:MAG: competence/damage-inducible protein A [Nitrospina sp.]|jgi:nicotinamide-nucleotide amidase|nr:competence/damage-inducible protein A [Nitrospina sp.]MBT3511415.1 competence/damage-inducible protein A [Nitrospina sp.]MBT3876327.1 competence/damage-inducible protein A [Nitrospina sp.]MBT4049957.1 competence/damage-inducible protein A [Nitrospina sp.]MBT4556643.1 competence/damage-inducible protein A [Nitrospina sp.]
MIFGGSKAPCAELVVIGDEVISGLILDRNSQFLGERIHELGIEVSRITTVGDSSSVIEDCIKLALQRSDWVVLTGGLGATHDDITKAALLKVFECGLKNDSKVAEMLEEMFRVRGREVPASVKTQCEVPEKAEILYNEKGTAPGFKMHRGKCILFSLPGVPREMQYLFEKYVAPEMASNNNKVFLHRLIKTTGLSEASLWEKVGPIEALQEKATIASLPSHLGVRIRISVLAESKQEGESRLDDAQSFLTKRLSHYIFGTDEEVLEEKIGDLLREKSLTLATAESCTGGLIGHRLTQVSGSSDYYKEGFVVYSNEAKTNRLGVKPALIEEFGAVSEQVAQAMAQGVCQMTGADIGVSVTGIAGPSGGSDLKPVGLTYIAVHDRFGTYCREFVFTHDRVGNKERSAQAALNLVRLRLQGELKA